MASINNTDGKASKHVIRHRTDAEWLTTAICDSYRKKAIPIISEMGEASEAFKQLRDELAYKCDITSLIAMNILRGYHAQGYVANEKYKKKLMENPSENNPKEQERREFEEWKQQKIELEEMRRVQRHEMDDWIIED